MRFLGYWVAEDHGKVVIKATEFDDTALSDHSNWKEAWQNEDPSLPHGFVDPLTMLQDVCRRMQGDLSEEQAGKLSERLNSEEGLEVTTLSGLIMLIQSGLPTAFLPSATGPGSRTVADEATDEIPFE